MNFVDPSGLFYYVRPLMPITASELCWRFGLCGNPTPTTSGDSAGPAEVPPPFETVEEAVTRCAKKLGVTIDAFSASSKGTNGYARISGSGTIRGVGVGLANYSITNDVNSFSGPELEELGQTSADMGITFQEGDLVATLRSGRKLNQRVGPSTNYTGNNLSNNRAIWHHKCMNSGIPSIFYWA